MIIWIIGISGAGKTTISQGVVERLRARGRHVLFLDGDDLRDVWSDDLGVTLEDRRKNHTRFSKLCALLDQDEEIDIVVAALSIFPDLQRWNRENIKGYYQVHLNVDVETAEARDPKGIYARARRGEAKDVVGIDFPFPEPVETDLRLDFTTTEIPVAIACDQVVASIEESRVACR